MCLISSSRQSETKMVALFSSCNPDALFYSMDRHTGLIRRIHPCRRSFRAAAISTSKYNHESFCHANRTSSFSPNISHACQRTGREEVNCWYIKVSLPGQVLSPVINRVHCFFWPCLTHMSGKLVICLTNYLVLQFIAAGYTTHLSHRLRRTFKLGMEMQSIHEW